MVLSSILPTVFSSQHHHQQQQQQQQYMQRQHSIDDHIGRLRIINDPPHDWSKSNHERQSNISTALPAFRIPRMMATALHRLTASVNCSRTVVAAPQQPTASSHDGVTPFSRRRVLLWTVALTLTVAYVSTAHVRHERAEESSSQRQEASAAAAASASALASASASTVPTTISSSNSSCVNVQVSHFVLWYALLGIPYNDSSIAEHARLQLYDGAALCLGDLPPKVNIQAVVDVVVANATTNATNCDDTTTKVSNATTTVVFDLLSMPKNRHRTEWEAPYMLAGHRGFKIFSMNCSGQWNAQWETTQKKKQDYA